MTPEQTAKLQMSRDSLAAAKLLSDNGFYRFAISRAYYTTFYAAEILLLEKGLTFSSHGAVIAAFGKEYAKTGLVPVHFHQYLIKGQEKRHAGDYDETITISETETLDQITRADEFIKLVETMLMGSP